MSAPVAGVNPPRQSRGAKAVLVVDVGGTHIKCASSIHRRRVRLPSGPAMTPERMMEGVLELTATWDYSAVSIGYPGVVTKGRIARDPWNMGPGWAGYDFRRAFGCPVRLINDAAMQALGAYRGGRMLFLGLGTGLGSALIVDGVIAPMELGHLRCAGKRTYEDLVGEKARKRLGNRTWRVEVAGVVEAFSNALLPEYIVLGGGNVANLNRLPPRTRRGGNADAIRGGLRLWEAAYAPGQP